MKGDKSKETGKMEEEKLHGERKRKDKNKFKKEKGGILKKREVSRSERSSFWCPKLSCITEKE